MAGAACFSVVLPFRDDGCGGSGPVCSLHSSLQGGVDLRTVFLPLVVLAHGSLERGAVALDAVVPHVLAPWRNPVICNLQPKTHMSTLSPSQHHYQRNSKCDVPRTTLKGFSAQAHVWRSRGGMGRHKLDGDPMSAMTLEKVCAPSRRHQSGRWCRGQAQRRLTIRHPSGSWGRG